MRKSIVGFLVLLLLFVGAASFMYFACSSKEGNASVIPVFDTIGRRNGMSSLVKSRKLKDNFDPSSPDQDGAGFVSLEDYRPIDPVPSYKTSIRPGPIQHEAPLLPYIPQPVAPPPSEQNYSSYP